MNTTHTWPSRANGPKRDAHGRFKRMKPVPTRINHSLRTSSIAERARQQLNRSMARRLAMHWGVPISTIRTK